MDQIPRFAANMAAQRTRPAFTFSLAVESSPLIVELLMHEMESSRGSQTLAKGSVTGGRTSEGSHPRLMTQQQLRRRRTRWTRRSHDEAPRGYCWPG